MLKKILRYISYLAAVLFLIFILGAALIFYPPPHVVPDTDPLDPGIKIIHANGLNFAYLEEGQGPLVLLLHGFPDNAHTWDLTMDQLAKNGYHAVAIFTRGYYPTEIPADGDYSAETMGKDALALIDAFGYKNAVIVGNDWGATEAYAAANINPTKVKGLVVVGIPHPKVISPNGEFFKKLPHFILFQFGPLSNWYASRNNFAYIASLYHYWAPSWQVPDSLIAQMKKDFSRPGRLVAVLRYYHFGILDGFDSRKTEIYKKITTVPTLAIVGEDDIMYKLGMFKDMPSAFSGSFQMAVFPKTGHFVQREQPALFAEKLLKFLKSLK